MHSVCKFTRGQLFKAQLGLTLGLILINLLISFVYFCSTHSLFPKLKKIEVLLTEEIFVGKNTQLHKQIEIKVDKCDRSYYYLLAVKTLQNRK